MQPTRLLTAALFAGACAGTAAAHDTWFEQRGDTPATIVLALGTGNQFPKQESSIGAEYLARQGCRNGDTAPARALKPLDPEAQALLLRPPPGARTCWVQLTPFEVTLAPDKIAIYLQDILASPEIRQTWAALAARGLPWRERYTKNARIELGGSAPSATPTPLGLDLHLETGGEPAQTGRALTAQALRDGQPLPGLALQWRHEDSRLGIWRRTDAHGRVHFTPPLTGRWVLRGVDLQLSADDPTRWDSRFATLAFEVEPAASTPPAVAAVADQNTKSFRLNARSTNQTDATVAISSDPPPSTATR
jgi:hypothetical protein